MSRDTQVSLQRVTARTPPHPQNEQVSGQTQTRVRAFLATRTFDVMLAVIGLAVTQVRIIQHPGGWSKAALPALVAVAVAPALIAIRRVDPVLASVGLTVGAFCSLLVGQVDYALLVGCALALWAMPTRCRPAASLVAVGVTAALPLLGYLRRSTFLGAIYPTTYYHEEHPEGGSTTIDGIMPDEFERIYNSPLPWCLSVGLLVVGLLAVGYHHRRRLGVAERTAGERIDDLRDFVLRAKVLDAVIAMLAVSLILVDLGRDIADGNWWSAPGWMPYAIALSALTLVLRRRLPVVPVVVLAIGALLAYWQTNGSWSILFALGIALYSLAAGRSARFSLPIATVVLTALPVLAALARYRQLKYVFPELKGWFFYDDFDMRGYHNQIYEDLVDRQWPVLLSLTLALAVAGGVLARLYRRNRAAAAREAELERRTAEQEAAHVVMSERSHIARDLHDVVAHAVNLMVIQAETGPDLLQRGDRDVLEGFQRIGDTGRRALGELDRLLSALRDADGVPDPQLAPQPGLAELRQLVRDVSHDRLEVSLELAGDPGAPPAGHQLTAYRLVQEALTNVARHADATRAKVSVQIGDDGIAVKVTDDGTGFDLEAAGKLGRHGLAGMRERVRVHAGSLGIATTPGAGTAVTAWIPVVQAEEMAR